LKSGVVVDTSVFVNFLRYGQCDILSILAAEDLVILSKIVRLELLKGAKRRDRKLLLTFLEGLREIEDFSPPDYVERLLLQLHGRGLNLGLADLLILSDASRLGVPLLTSDMALAEAAKILKIALLQ